MMNRFPSITSMLNDTSCKNSQRSLHKTIKKVGTGNKTYNPTTDTQRRELLRLVIEDHNSVNEVKICFQMLIRLLE
jgi:hypothetical protein